MTLFKWRKDGSHTVFAIANKVKEKLTFSIGISFNKHKPTTNVHNFIRIMGKSRGPFPCTSKLMLKLVL